MKNLDTTIQNLVNDIDAKDAGITTISSVDEITIDEIQNTVQIELEKTLQVQVTVNILPCSTTDTWQLFCYPTDNIPRKHQSKLTDYARIAVTEKDLHTLYTRVRAQKAATIVVEQLPWQDEHIFQQNIYNQIFIYMDERCKEEVMVRILNTTDPLRKQFLVYLQ